MASFPSFDDSGLIELTDYYDSPEFRVGVPYCLVGGMSWHLILPPFEAPVYPHRRSVFVLPVQNDGEALGWRWKMWFRPDWTVELPHVSFYGEPVPLPDPGSETVRRLFIYGHIKGRFEIAHRARLYIMRAPQGSNHVELPWKDLRYIAASYEPFLDMAPNHKWN